jgi:DNA (cytosine-5)-methyltransferase 1
MPPTKKPALRPAITDARDPREQAHEERGRSMPDPCAAYRPPVLRVHVDGLVVDSFAGGGGASLGIEWALGRSPDLAINHDREAIRMHAVNHPSTRHYCEDVWQVDPEEACGGRKVALAWFSPDCCHHSKAKGGKPVSSKRRALAWGVVRWARAVHPRVIVLENVEEFQDWGPLDERDRPDALRRGFTFRRWLGCLKAAGYAVEHRELRACDYGAPTTRKRLFVVARCDGQPIVWPEPTHGPGLILPWRTAAECIRWGLPCPSIFERDRPLAEATLRRIARGIRKFVLEAADPFTVPMTHPRDARIHSVRGPLPTITAAHRGELGLVAPTLVQRSWGERPGQAPRILDINAPMGTVVAGGIKQALVEAFLEKAFGGGKNGKQVSGLSPRQPFSTITTNHHRLAVAHLSKLYGTSTGAPMGAPMPTITAGGGKGGGHIAEVRAFLVKYFGTSDAAPLRDGMPTITTRDRFGLITVAGEDYEIRDIGLRMLVPRELYRGQGFPDSYAIDHDADGVAFTKTTQVRMVGNSVCPPIAAAIVQANMAERKRQGAQVPLALFPVTSEPLAD